MADRYQNRPFPAADDYDGGAYPDAAAKAESDPLAELARLIGQTDPFGTASKAQPPHPLLSRANARPPAAEDDEAPPAGPPSWMQRARREAAAPSPPPPIEYDEPEQDYQPSAVHPLHRYAAPPAQPAPEPVAAYQPTQAYEPATAFDEEAQQHSAAGQHEQDPSRYDDALYGQLESGQQQDLEREPAYPDDPYAYQGYEEEPEPRRRSKGLIMVAAVLALGVFGVGGAYAYRTYVGSPRSGEPPIIKADNTPTKVIPAQAEAPAKTPDRMAAGDGSEKIVSREETPVDPSTKATGPRVVFPPLNANANPPPPASVQTAPPPPAPASANGTLPNNEPRKIRTLSVKGDNPDGAQQAAAGAPAKPPAAAKQPPASRSNPAAANASVNAPMSLTPGEQANAAPVPAAPPTRLASTTTASVSSGYMVQVSSQKNEADAQASYRSLQGKFPSVLGSHPPVIRRADLGEKGVYYRAMVGPFGSPEEASQFCGNLKSAGGQCVVQRN
ncbi:SPOR domain-containing protein [Bradyrhizobium tropiciagri]|uniref:SPOR domain-containing protein n=1 Tax=Bradyrhizobium tropiciagri TaxID=312253 RepID=UPI001BACD7C3|nr:SPOR domain-containing protein [Bradyrhizobium tropiciagri]MBR0872590.1 SPOR domain-containing protein [Bradyrhizobium tropiciagri]